MSRSLAVWVVCCWASIVTAASPGTAPDQTTTAIDFNRDVRPILSDNCFHCHGPDSATREAGLRLDLQTEATHDLGGYAALVPGDADASELIRRIESEDDPMPPDESNRKLTAAEKHTLRRWIESGGDFAKHWSFAPPVRPAIPVVDQETKNPIDAFVAQRQHAVGLTFSAEADPETLIRRVTLDLNGLPPAPSQVDAFVADYSRNGDAAWDRLVDRLLQSPRYGETMALPWLDAARFADTDGYQYDGPRFQWRWRDWVIDAYNTNLPFDQFTMQQLAGDLMPPAETRQATNNQIIATAFNRNHRYNSESGLVVEEFLLENAVDRVDTTATLWMGLTVGCARCHDHKFDPISQRDYYQLLAFFNSVPEAGRAVKNGNSEPTAMAPTDQQFARLLELEQATETAARQLNPADHPDDSVQLVDRSLAHAFPLTELPKEHAKATGAASFADNSLVLDGDSTLEIGEITKAITFRADSSFSVAFWLRPDDLRDSVILSRQTTTTTRPGIELSLVDGGRLQFDLITRWVAGVGRATSTLPLAPDRWTHVTITYDGSQSARGQRIYFDGKPIATDVTYNTNSNVGGVKQNRPLILGGGIRPDSQNLIGALRDVRLYTNELWAEEVALLGADPSSPERQTFAQVKPTPAYKRYVRHRETLDAFRKTLPTVMVMQDTATPKTTFVRNRGVYNKHGEQVQRAVPGMLPPMPEHFPRNRLGLAMWLVAPEHPLTARVAVNRYWQKYFGTGLVKTPEDFGTQSELPSHPELLDWLATEFIASGWDIAHMQKLIVTSRTYRQRSQVTPRQLDVDPSNAYLARTPRLRLDAHAIRDQALFVSGLLAERVGGPSVSPYQPDGLWAEMSMGMKYKQSDGEDLFRRSLYTIWKRTVAPPTMSVFDAADRESCWVGRKRTNTPLQALTLLNETGFVESARQLAVRMMATDDPIGFGFRTVTARPPEPHERKTLQQALDGYRGEFTESPAAASELITVGRSPQFDQGDPIELAACTLLANVLLNLDEVITRE
ncbi:DUF1553 domain-containing protein [Stieleria sp. TO1_6]|uniref:DUF1553 domain-containing protein n=1 Tax=Stieleria tagensis TaxID=2956795 RepID=UPI00209AA677|nr:DUF1553 domain-containing protein [Stieleria tagensis]MCO8124337.1 DUF1553 domain-containing protein [Stieleria tagensis]